MRAVAEGEVRDSKGQKAAWDSSEAAGPQGAWGEVSRGRGPRGLGKSGRGCTRLPGPGEKSA